MITYYFNEQLQKVGICLSHSTACKLIIMLGEGHDTLVKEWRDQFSLMVIFSLDQSKFFTQSVSMEAIVASW